MRFTCEVRRVSVIVGYGTDKVSIETDLPCSIETNRSEGYPTHLRLEVTQGRGEAYARNLFKDVPIEVLNTRGRP